MDREDEHLRGAGGPRFGRRPVRRAVVHDEHRDPGEPRDRFRERGDGATDVPFLVVGGHLDDEEVHAGTEAITLDRGRRGPPAT
jgi:hypothetical protein